MEAGSNGANTPNILTFGLTSEVFLIFWKKHFIFGGGAAVPWDGGIPREDHSLAIQEHCWDPTRLAVVGPTLWFLYCPLPCERVAEGWGGYEGKLTPATDFQRLPGAGLGWG